MFYTPCFSRNAQLVTPMFLTKFLPRYAPVSHKIPASLRPCFAPTAYLVVPPVLHPILPYSAPVSRPMLTLLRPLFCTQYFLIAPLLPNASLLRPCLSPKMTTFPTWKECEPFLNKFFPHSQNINFSTSSLLIGQQWRSCFLIQKATVCTVMSFIF